MEESIFKTNQEKFLKIAIVGPESSGKSTIAQQLANHFQTNMVPEYARAYIKRINRPYTEEDLLEIAKGQIALEEKLAKETEGILICDTTLLVIKIWSEVKFGRCDPWIQKRFLNNFYSCYFLCDIDIPWEEDPQREHPDPEQRSDLFSRYVEGLKETDRPTHLLSGDHENRFAQAVKIISNLKI